MASAAVSSGVVRAGIAARKRRSLQSLSNGEALVATEVLASLGVGREAVLDVALALRGVER